MKDSKEDLLYNRQRHEVSWYLGLWDLKKKSTVFRHSRLMKAGGQRTLKSYSGGVKVEKKTLAVPGSH